MAANVSPLLSFNTLLPHSSARLSVNHSTKGQTGVLCVTPDPAMTQWTQIHQGRVTAEFTGVIYCSKTQRAPEAMYGLTSLFLKGPSCWLLPRAPAPQWESGDCRPCKQMKTCHSSHCHTSNHIVLQGNEMWNVDFSWWIIPFCTAASEFICFSCAFRW